MKYCFLVLSWLFSMGASGQEALYKGTLGKYPIEMELTSPDGENYTGRYRYEGKKEWIPLKGKTEQLTARLNEYVGNKQTGMFLLNFEEDRIIGTWQKTKADKTLEVKLKFTEKKEGLTGEYAMIGDVDNSRFPEVRMNDR